MIDLLYNIFIIGMVLCGIYFAYEIKNGDKNDY